MADQKFWIMRQTIEVFVLAEDNMRVVNYKAVHAADLELRRKRSVKITGDPIVLPGFPYPNLWLDGDFAPDYFEYHELLFVSRRFREAFAQPADVVQYWPVEIDRASASAAARAQDYRLLRILAWQEAMDWERSVYSKYDGISHTDEHFTSVSPRRFVPLRGLVARTEVFRSAEQSLTKLVTDALAERVMRAGCEGVVFYEPETIGILGTRHIRTATGVEAEGPYTGPQGRDCHGNYPDDDNFIKEDGDEDEDDIVADIVFD